MVPSKGNGAGGGKIRLGELLVKAGVITESQLKTALQEQRQWGGKLGDILVRMRYLSEDVFVRALSKQLGIPRADFTAEIPLDALAKVPAEIAEEYEIVPVGIFDEGKTLAIATSDPLNITVIDYIRGISRLRIVAHVAGASQIRAAIARLYQNEAGMNVGGGGDNSELRILANSEDMVPAAPGHSTPPQGGVYGGRQNGSSGTNPSMPAVRPAQPPPSQPPAYPPQYGYQPGAYAAMPTPAPMTQYGGPMALPQQQQQQPVLVPMAQPYTPPQQGEEAQRREVAALKALVELLVQKGVISLDEYLARLKR